MATSKKQIAEQAMRILSGGHLKPDRTIDIREVMLNLDQVRDELVRESTKNNIKLGAYKVDDDYLTFTDVLTVSAAGVNGLKFITITTDIISLPFGLGLYQVSPIDDLENIFHITEPGAVGMYSGSQALENSGIVYCWKIGDVVYFKNLPAAITEVVAMIAASSREIGELDSFPVPPDVEDLLLKRLLATFGIEQQQPHDEIEDGIK